VGLNQLEVTVAGVHISGSPFLVNVADGLSKGSTSTAKGNGFWVGSNPRNKGKYTKANAVPQNVAGNYC
jgi:hypothetical protein